jgi:hypothetical protein
MKIEKLELLDLNELNYDKRLLEYDATKSYLGYLDFDASTSGFKDAVAFSVENVTEINNKLVGDFNVINAKGTELLVWIDEFTIKPTIEITIDEDIIESNNVLSSKLISFVAYPS